MAALLDDPRIRDLLRQADAADALLETLSAQGGDTVDVRATLDAVLRDLGQAVWRSARPSAELPESSAAEPTRARDADTDERWYTEEVDLPLRLFDPGDLAEVAEDLRTDEVTEMQPGSFRIESLDSAELRRRDSVSALAALDSESAPEWAGTLKAMRELMGAPSTDESTAALEQEAAQLQWCASNLEPQLQGLPDVICSAVVAGLGCRVRRVSLLLEDALGTELAMKRLREYRVARQLPMVVALSDAGRPERGAWIRDALAWWALISPEEP